MKRDELVAFLRQNDPAEISTDRLAVLHTKIWQHIHHEPVCTMTLFQGVPSVSASRWEPFLFSKKITVSLCALLFVGFFLGQEIAPLSSSNTYGVISSQNDNTEQLYVLSLFGSPWQIVTNKEKE